MEKIYLVLDIVFMIGLFCLIADIMKTKVLQLLLYNYICIHIIHIILHKYILL